MAGWSLAVACVGAVLRQSDEPPSSPHISPKVPKANCRWIVRRAEARQRSSPGREIASRGRCTTRLKPKTENKQPKPLQPETELVNAQERMRYEIDEYVQPAPDDDSPNVNCVHSWKLAPSSRCPSQDEIVISQQNGWSYSTTDIDCDRSRRLLSELHRISGLTPQTSLPPSNPLGLPQNHPLLTGLPW